MRSIKIPLLAALCLAMAAMARAKPVNFELPAQPAATALLAFAKQAGMDVLFSYEDMKKVQSSAVVGSYEPEAALTLLLRDTGFEATLKAPGKFVVKRARKSPKSSEIRRPVVGATGDGEAPSVKGPEDATDLGPVVALKEFIVTPSRFAIAQERVATTATLTNAELEALPQLGEDLYHTITRLPGLAADDYSAKFWVRGAPNSQMLARLDGVDLIEPFHLKDFDGSLSIVDLRTIGSIDLVTGGFTTDYGDRLAGVLTMETQENIGPRMLTTLGLSAGDMSATNQGGFSDGRGQWMVAARRGYLDIIAELGGSKLGFSTDYYDLSSKVEYQLNPHNKFSLHVLYAGDSMERLHKYDEPDLRSNYDSAYVWGRWQGDFGERLSGEGVLSFSQLDWLRNGSGLIDYNSHQFMLHDDRRLDTLGLRQDWTLNLTEHALVRAGFEFKSGEARYDYSLFRQLWSLSNGDLLDTTRTDNFKLRPAGHYAAAYIAPRFQPWSSLTIEPGLRFEHHSDTGDSGWSPRLNVSLALGPRTTARAAWGIYEQAQGLQELSVQDGETRFSPPERAEQRVLGISHELESGVALRAEAYERLSTHLRPHWENMIEPFNVFPESLYDRIELDPSRGLARGIELTAEHRGKGRFGWGASYTYAVSEEQVGNRWIPLNRDQRNTFYVDMTYVPARDWQLSCSWQYHTGWPTTDIIYSLVRLNDGSLTYTWTYGPYSSLRAPAYHRLDLRATRTFHLKHSLLRTYVDIFNAYDQRNVDGYDMTSATIVNGQLIVAKPPLKLFPILPSAGLSWEF
jgi:outer membrane cobalamin receptor